LIDFLILIGIGLTSSITSNIYNKLVIDYNV